MSLQEIIRKKAIEYHESMEKTKKERRLDISKSFEVKPWVVTQINESGSEISQCLRSLYPFEDNYTYSQSEIGHIYSNINELIGDIVTFDPDEIYYVSETEKRKLFKRIIEKANLVYDENYEDWYEFLSEENYKKERLQNVYKENPTFSASPLSQELKNVLKEIVLHAFEESLQCFFQNTLEKECNRIYADIVTKVFTIQENSMIANKMKLFWIEYYCTNIFSNQDSHAKEKIELYKHMKICPFQYFLENFEYANTELKIKIYDNLPYILEYSPKKEKIEQTFALEIEKLFEKNSMYLMEFIEEIAKREEKG